MAVRRVTLSIFGDDSNVKRVLEEVERKKREVAGDVKIKVRTDTAAATMGLDRLGQKMDRLSRSAIDIKVRDKLAQTELERLRLKLRDMHSTDWSARVNVADYEKTKLELTEIERKLREIKRSETRIRLGGLTGGRGGLFGLIGKLGGGGGAGGGPEGGAGGLGGLAGNPWVTGIAVALAGAIAAALAPALAGLAAGGAIGGGGIIAGLLGNPGQLKAFKSELASMFKSIAAAAKPLSGAFVHAFGGLGNFVKSQGPALKRMFSAAIPFIKMFVNLMEKAGKVLIPAFTQTMKAMAPSLPQMSKALLQIVKAFAYFLKDLGPGMKSSSRIFLALATGLKGLMIGLAAVCNGLATTFVALGHAARVMGHWISNAWDWSKRATTSAMNWIGHAVQNIGGFFQKLPGRILGFLKGLGAALYRIGQQMVSGLINGIKSMIGAAFDAIKNFVGGLIGAAKGMLGIGSPSKVFHAFGLNVAEGMALGIREGAHLAIGEAAAMADAVGGHRMRPPHRVGRKTVRVRTPLMMPGGGMPDTPVQWRTIRMPAAPRENWSRGDRGGDTYHLHVEFSGLVGDPNATAKKIEQVLANLRRQRGGRRLAFE